MKHRASDNVDRGGDNATPPVEYPVHSAVYADVRDIKLRFDSDLWRTLVDFARLLKRNSGQHGFVESVVSASLIVLVIRQ